MPSGDASSPDQASRIFVTYLARREAGEVIDADEFCAQHPEQADELRELMAGLGELEGDAERLGPTGESPELGSGSSIRAGVRVGDLRILRRIGRGAQGQVFEAHQISLDRHVAVKVLPLDWTTRERQIERFRREAMAAGQLDHEHVVRVYGLEEWSNHLLIVQEFVDGGSLEDRLSQGEVDDREAAEICRQIAEGLHQVHERGILHRDVKPANIMLSRLGSAKLGDFGLARMDSDGQPLTVTGDLVGTPWYMSPEQVAGGRGGIDARTDIYSLGAVLYRLLVGEVPIKGDGDKGLYLDILTREPRRPRQVRPAVDSDLEAVCLKAIRKAPGDRYQDAGDFAHDLQRWLQGESTDARPMGPASRVGQVMRHVSAPTVVLWLLTWVGVAFALDQLLLRPAAELDPEQHALRLVLSAVFALGVGYLLSLIGRRFSRGRGWGPALSWLLTLALAVTLWRGVQAEELSQRLGTARNAFVMSLDASGERRDVMDIEAYVNDWEQRFEGRDLALVARGYIKRKRPALAADWVEQLAGSGAVGPLMDVLRAVLHESRGELEQCDALLVKLWDTQAKGDAREWLEVGHVYREAGRLADAYRAYQRSVSESDTIEHERNLRLALTCIDLCRWEEAAVFLGQFRRYRPDDVRGLGAALAIARQIGPVESVAAVRSAIEQLDLPIHDKVRLAGNVSVDDLERLVDESAENPELLNLACFAATASQDYELARNLYSRLNSMQGGSAVALVGLSNASMALGDYRSAEAHARSATAHDPDFWEGHYNLSWAIYYVAAYGVKPALGYETVSLEVKQACFESARRALRCNGFNASTLNLAVWWGSLVARHTGELGEVPAMIRWGEAAVRFADPARAGGECGGSRASLANAHDTLRLALETGGETERALAAARAAVASSDSSSKDYADFVAHVQRLEAAAVDGQR